MSFFESVLKAESEVNTARKNGDMLKELTCLSILQNEVYIASDEIDGRQEILRKLMASGATINDNSVVESDSEKTPSTSAKPPKDIQLKEDFQKAEEVKENQPSEIKPPISVTGMTKQVFVIKWYPKQPNIVGLHIPKKILFICTKGPKGKIQ